MDSDENQLLRNIEADEPQSLGCKKVAKKLKSKRAECERKFDKWENCGAEKGDLIEIKRHLYISHWGVYVGDDEIIHLCGGKYENVVVGRHSLKDVAEDSLCRVNNLEAAALRRGLVPKSVNSILKEAHKYLETIVDYDPIDCNCEHFVTHCRFGSGDYIPGQSGFSEQALAAKGEGLVKNGARLVTKSWIGTDCCSRIRPKHRD
jgi:hypothetical protein